MGSQFVDFNGDGYLDYLSATFDGSPHLALGSAEGFGKPKRLKDAKGERILISYYWNYDDKQHQVTGRSLGTETPPKERCISALAFDWDGDGDFDLLLGGYEGGHLYLQMNEGSNAKPAFTGVNIPVMAGDAPFTVPNKMTTPRLVDWDGDGDMDLVAGSFGDSHSPNGAGGAVYLSRNTGSKGKPVFAALETLIPPSPKGGTAPTRPDEGLYPEVVDWDGDGDLDLVVGGYSRWTPPGKKLTAEQTAEVATLRSEQRELRAKQAEHSKAMAKEVAAATAGMERLKAREASSVIYRKHNKKTMAFVKRNRELTAKIQELVPGPQRKSFVWLYERR